LHALQENLIRSHACGMGEQVPFEISRLIFFLKIENISQGFSGVSPKLIDQMIKLFNAGVAPVLFKLGSLGASGDLAPLAHLGLMIMGEGEALLMGNPVTAGQALEAANCSPHRYLAKEGLAILNGTQFSSAYCLYGALHGKKICRLANLIASLSLDAYECNLSPFDPRIQQVRPHPGQSAVAKDVLENLEGRQALNGESHKVQDPYAFRCIPQVHGATYDVLDYVEKTALNEANAVTDNPLIFFETDAILSGGNFHAQPIALSSDFLTIALSEIGSISERRIFQLISGQRGLPPFLTSDPGLNSGMMIAQYTAASIASQNKQLCTPASADNIVSSNFQEDHVSMGANAGTKLFRVVENVYRILAIEWMSAAQAMHFRKQRKTSPKLSSLIDLYRKETPVLEKDRVLSDDMRRTVTFLKDLDV
ncbi:MAG: histidine ammonia-lyase, partial [Saprospiraceae bacterium]|nr:histidine ammonia-lyase [Saprospiraceae bacterium]